MRKISNGTTVIYWVQEQCEGRPYTRIWDGMGEKGRELLACGDTRSAMDEEVSILLSIGWELLAPGDF